MEKNKKVLLLAYYFPPAGGGGVQRVTKFVKYLPEYGWQPIVVTANDDCYIERDITLLNEISEKVRLIRVPSLISQNKAHNIRKSSGAGLPWEDNKPIKLRGFILEFIRNFLLIPDSQILWVIPAIIKLVFLLRRGEFDVIWATAPPYSTLLFV